MNMPENFENVCQLHMEGKISIRNAAELLGISHSTFYRRYEEYKRKMGKKVVSKGSVFAATVGLPEEGLLTNAYLELSITTFLTAVASAAMGLFVSSLFTNADRAMTVAPILLMPQILFSGLIFKLDGATEMISWFAVCRWSMEGYGTTANLNQLQLKLQQQGVVIPHEAESFFDFTDTHVLASWGILLIFTVAFLVMARIVLSTIGKEKS